MKEPLKPGDKWCPMARAVIMEAWRDSAANRFPGGMAWQGEWASCRCLGSACAVFVGDDASGHCGLVRGA